MALMTPERRIELGLDALEQNVLFLEEQQRKDLPPGMALIHKDHLLRLIDQNIRRIQRGLRA